MSTPKILVGCPLVEHKTVVFDYFMKSLLDQTVNDFEIVFVYSRRQRGQTIKQEDLLRQQDMSNKMKRLWNVFRDENYDFFWNIASDTWYPPNSLEYLLELQHKSGAGMVNQICWNRFRRNLYSKPWDTKNRTDYDCCKRGECKDKEGYHLTGIGSILFARKIYEKGIRPRWEITNKHHWTGMDCMLRDVRKSHIKVVLGRKFPAWHLYQANDVVVSNPHIIMGGIPKYLLSKYPNGMFRRRNED